MGRGARGRLAGDPGEARRAVLAAEHLTLPGPGPLPRNGASSRA
jgi:hypothetical protein